MLKKDAVQQFRARFPGRTEGAVGHQIQIRAKELRDAEGIYAPLLITDFFRFRFIPSRLSAICLPTSETQILSASFEFI